MAFDRYLIAGSKGVGFDTGLQTDLKPFMIADDAYAQLENAYVFRGRTRKRFGSSLMGGATNQFGSRLRVNLGSTVAGALSGTVPGAIFKVGQAFSIGTEMFTVQALGTPVNMKTTGASTVHTYNTTTGAFVFTGAAAAAPVWFYPSSPVMGFTIFENGPINNQPTYAFDTQFAYVFNTNAWALSAGSPTWHGNDLNFFWAYTVRYVASQTSLTALVVSNFFATNPNGAADPTNDDPMYYLDSATGNWIAFTPKFLTAGAGNIVLTARIIVMYQNRLLLLNTIERNSANDTNSNFVNRCRYSQVGSPFTADAFLEPGQLGALGGDLIDAPTAEAIITAEFVKDRLIVYFERSTYELAFRGNEVDPFRWNKLNDELGSESTFSVVPFDQECLAIGSTGVHSCNGSNVSRIDNRIPDTIFTIKNSGSATARVAGIRDYFAEMVYWTYPSDNKAQPGNYPNKILVFNYKNLSWSQNDDSITVWGYFEQKVSNTWADYAGMTWEQATFAWNNGQNQPLARRVIAGNQEGFTFFVNTDLTRNARALQISDVTLSGTTLTFTVNNHNLLPSNRSDNGDYILIELAQGSPNINNLIFPVSSISKTNRDIFTVVVPVGFTLGGVYTGGGLISRVSNIKIRSKQWNPYDKDGQNVYLARIDFAVKKTTFGEITVDYFPSATQLGMLGEAFDTESIMGTGVLETFPYPQNMYPLEQSQDRLWHPVYFQTSGECIQIYMYMNDAQMRSVPIAVSDFDLQALILHTQKTSARLQ